MGQQHGLITTPGLLTVNGADYDIALQVNSGKTIKFLVNNVLVNTFGGSTSFIKTHSAFSAGGLYLATFGLSTPGNTETTAYSIAVPSGYSIHFRVFLGAKQSDETDASTFTLLGAATNAAGTTAIKGTVNKIAVESDASTDATVDADDTTDVIRVRCTGIAAETWLWEGSIEYMFSDAAT